MEANWNRNTDDDIYSQASTLRFIISLSNKLEWKIGKETIIGGDWKIFITGDNVCELINILLKWSYIIFTEIAKVIIFPNKMD